MKNHEGKAKNGNRKSIALIVLSIVVILLIGLVVFLLVNKQDSKKEDGITIQTTQDPEAMIVDDDNADDIMESLQKDSDDTMFNCRMSHTWTFENGKAKSENAYVANTDYNHYAIYFDVQLTDTQETIYTSSLIPVGSEINGLTLDKELPAGEYPASVNYHLVNDDNQEVSSVGFTITIQVLH